MSVESLLEQLRNLAIRLSLDDGQNLRIQGNKSALTATLLSQIKANKAALVSYLAAAGTDLQEQSVKCYPTSVSQHRFWLIDQMLPGSTHYNLPVSFPVPMPFAPAIAQKAFQCIVDRHEVLRTVFIKKDKQSFQQVLPKCEFKLASHDLFGLPDAKRRYEQLVAENAETCFDLSKGPLFQAAFVRLGVSEGVLLVNLHHIIADQWSLDILINEFSIIYESLATGKGNPLPPLSLQYGDYAKWQRRHIEADNNDMAAHGEYWQTQLKDLPVSHNLPLKQSRPAYQTFEGKLSYLKLEGHLSGKVREVAKAHKLSHFMLFNGVFALLLARFSASRDIVMGVPVNTRSQSRFEGLVGPFLNTYVLRFDCDESLTVSDYLQSVRQTNMAAMKHQSYPFEALVDALNPARSASHTPLFQVLVNQNAPSSEVTTIPETDEPVLTKYDLTLNITAFADQFVLTFEYNSDLFEAAFIAQMKLAMHHLLEQMAGDIEAQLQQLSLMPGEMQARWLAKLRSRPADFSNAPNLAAYFSQKCALYSDKSALKSAGEALSYQQLEARANQLSHYLKVQGVAKGDKVALLLSPGLELVVAMLAIIKTGAAFVPLNPQFPKARMAEIAQDAQIKQVVTEGAFAGLFARLPESPEAKAVGLTLLDDENTRHNIAECQSTVLLAADEISADDLAYVIYTSGSTGKPKGVMISHRAVVNFINAAVQGLTVDDAPSLQGNWLLQTTISFDVAILEWGCCLSSGNTCVIAPQSVVEDAFLLADFIDEQEVLLMQATPSRYKQLLLTGWQGRENLTLLCGGEALDAQLQQSLWQNSGALFNCYGPTEATVWSMIRQVTQQDIDEQAVPLGAGLANYSHLVVDSHGRLVPPGVVGELAIAGESLARGYLNREDLTSARFVDFTSPEGKDGFRIYLTGDLAKYDDNGCFELLGRSDAQVKVHGYRIELGEIESRLLQMDEVKNASVLLNVENNGADYLAAFIMVEPSVIEAPELIQRVSTFLQQGLPAYMQPKVITPLLELPLNTNGKVDKHQLKKQLGAAPQQVFVEPHSDNEKMLAAIWQTVLKKDRVGIRDNFFQSGGDSLLLVELAAKLREKDIKVSIKQLLENQTIEELLQHLANNALMDNEDILVKFNDNSSGKSPLFIVHPLSGTVFDFEPLGQQLADVVPVYGVQAPYLANKHFNYKTIKELAQFYFAEIQKRYPDGLYRFSGVSAGVPIAYQMAVLASEQNLPVELLISLDNMPFDVFDQINQHWQAIELCADLVLPKTTTRSLLLDCQNQSDTQQRQLLAKAINDSGQSRYFASIEVSEFVDFVVDYALADSPQCDLAIGGQVVHFATAQNPYRQRMLDAWSESVKGEYKIVPLQGSHEDIYSENNLATFVATITKLIKDKALKGNRG